MYHLELTEEEFEMVNALANTATVRGREQIEKLQVLFHKLDEARRNAHQPSAPREEPERVQSEEAEGTALPDSSPQESTEE